MLGVAAVAAAALMAFAGAGTASASVLCKTAPNAKGNCPVGWGYSGEIHAASIEKPRLTGGLELVCSESTFKANLSEGTKVSTETPNGPVAAFTLVGECNCEFVIVNPGTREIHAIGDTGNGTVTSNGTKVTVNCNTIFGKVHCIYVTNNRDFGEMIGGSDPTITVTTEIQKEETSGLCGAASWHFKYTITTPSALWVATATE